MNTPVQMAEQTSEESNRATRMGSSDVNGSKESLQITPDKSWAYKKEHIEKHSNIIIATFLSNMVSLSLLILLVLLTSCIYEGKHSEKRLTLTMQRS